MRRLTLLALFLGLLIPWLIYRHRPTEPTATFTSTAAPTSAGIIVVDFADGTPEESFSDVERLIAADLVYSSSVSTDEALTWAWVENRQAAIEILATHPLVEAVEPAMTFTALGYPDDPLYAQQWNLRKVGAETGWRAGAGHGVRVAVIDTGVTPGPDLAGTRVEPGMSFIPDVSLPLDDNGHGTHVAGTIAQTTNNGIGVAGVAPNAIIVPYKVLSAEGSGRSDWIAAAIDEAVDQGAQVINLSLGGPHSEVLHIAVEKAVAAGVVVVAAAGNSGVEGVGCPGHVSGAIGVSATGPNDALAPYSSWGAGVDMAAPGGDKRVQGGGILQETVDGGDHQFSELQGTSMAAPHVAGAAAILLSAGAGSATEVKDLLYSSSLDLGAPGFDTRFGHGRLDIHRAVRALSLHRRAGLFTLAGLVGFLVAGLGGGPGRQRLTSALVAAATAGGLFFIPWLLPLPPGLCLSLASRGFLLWPAVLFSPTWVNMPLWVSAVLPLGLAFILGPSRRLSPWVLGFCAGIGTHLFHGAATGALQPWLMPAPLAILWLTLNGLIALLAAMAVAGLHRR